MPFPAQPSERSRGVSAPTPFQLIHNPTFKAFDNLVNEYLERAGVIQNRWLGRSIVVIELSAIPAALHDAHAGWKVLGHRLSSLSIGKICGVVRLELFGCEQVRCRVKQ
jgi:hypothetical protein